MLRDLTKNPLTFTDCYNTSHEELKVNTDWDVSHLYNRAKGMFLFGYVENITERVLNVIYTKEMVEEGSINAKEMGLVFPYEMWMRVINECNGRLPLRVECLPEGTWCPTGTPYGQVKNTVKGFGELVTWFEALMLHYFPSACLTEAYEMRKYLESKNLPLNRFHSFGFRGHKSLEDAYWAGISWSMMLPGTDDFHIRQHLPKEIKMSSISALAHKVTQQYDFEYDCFINAIDKAAANGTNIVAMVIDTYNAKRVIGEWVVRLTAYAQSKGVFVVWRPDSGNIKEQVYEIYHLLNANDLLKSGATIVGEGMSFINAIRFDSFLSDNDIPLGFVSYGIGAGFYKKVERDTHGQAMKTAFSNKKPRMKLVAGDPFKMSIPNEIHLLYINGRLTVCDGAGHGEYITIYKYVDNLNIWQTRLDSSHFVEVKNRVLSQSCVQERIVLSEETKSLIEDFKDMYGN